MSPTAIERGAATRVRLLEATARLIAEVGWGEVTTRAIAEAAGVNAGLVHYHFGSVDELRRAATLHALTDALAGPVVHMLAEDHAATGLDALVSALAGYDADDPLLALTYEALLAANRDAELSTALRDLLREFRRATAAWVAATTDAPDPDAVATLLAAALDGLFLHRVVDPDLDIAAGLAPIRRLLT